MGRFFCGGAGDPVKTGEQISDKGCGWFTQLAVSDTLPIEPQQSNGHVVSMIVERGRGTQGKQESHKLQTWVVRDSPAIYNSVIPVTLARARPCDVR